MKIILSGPAPSGKTTLARQIIGDRDCYNTMDMGLLESLDAKELSDIIIFMDNMRMSSHFLDVLAKSHQNVIVTTVEEIGTIQAGGILVFKLPKLDYRAVI